MNVVSSEDLVRLDEKRPPSAALLHPRDQKRWQSLQGNTVTSQALATAYTSTSTTNLIEQNRKQDALFSVKHKR
jgi:hypothetical protein